MRKLQKLFSIKLIAAFICVSQIVETAQAQWSDDPNINNPVSTAQESQSFPLIVKDGAGGMIISWLDTRNIPSTYDLYAQRISPTGSPLWTADGISITIDSAAQSDHQIISDGEGGAILVWRHTRYPPLTVDIYAQKINAAGAIQWISGGVPVCVTEGEQAYPTLATDGRGGAIIAWTETQNGQQKVRAQRINSSGAVLWETDGVIISDSGSSVSMVDDGLSGAVIVYRRIAPQFSNDIYAQRVDSSGVMLWGSTGVPVCAAPYNQTNAKLIADGTAGAIVVWEDSRNGGTDIYAQRVDGAGSILWTVNGVPISTANGSQRYPFIVSDGVGGAIIAWNDTRTNSNPYAQRVNADGSAIWTLNGVEVCNCWGSPVLASDGKRGAIVAWVDSRGADWDIYAQRVDSMGAKRWDSTGEPISTAPSFQNEVSIISDESKGAVIVWQDSRTSGFSPDIYAQRVSGEGDLGGSASSVHPIDGIPSTISITQNYPNPFNPSTKIEFDLPVRSWVTLGVYNILGEELEELMNGYSDAGSHSISWTTNRQASGIYFARFVVSDVSGATKFKKTIKLVLIK